MSSHRFISWVEIPVYVDYEYQPYERQTYEYPGCEEGVSLNDIEIDKDIKDTIMKENENRFHEEALEDYRDKQRGRY